MTKWIYFPVKDPSLVASGTGSGGPVVLVMFRATYEVVSRTVAWGRSESKGSCDQTLFMLSTGEI